MHQRHGLVVFGDAGFSAMRNRMCKYKIWLWRHTAELFRGSKLKNSSNVEETNIDFENKTGGGVGGPIKIPDICYSELSQYFKRFRAKQFS